MERVFYCEVAPAIGRECKVLWLVFQEEGGEEEVEVSIQVPERGNLFHLVLEPASARAPITRKMYPKNPM